MAFDEIRSRYLDEIERDTVRAAGSAGLLFDMIRAHLATGGKRLRALLPIWMAENRAGRGAEAVPLGVGLELLHNATLVHDDLQDGDTMRRGQPTVWRRYGANQAINVGDALYFAGLASIARGATGSRLVEPMCRMMTRVIEGQTMEFQLQCASGDPNALPATPENWERMARGKTGALFGGCLRAGAAAGGASSAEQDEAATYGESLGLLFQVQDDYLDMVGDKGRGQRGSDLAEGKISFPVTLAYAQGSPRAVEALRLILAKPREETSEAMITRGISLLADTGALEATAAWLRRARDTATGHRLAPLIPGLAERFLAPVAHAL